MTVPFQPMRSLIYVDCVREQYRHKLKHWLYYYHVPESISQFQPYVSKYAFYSALPVPPEGERFGTYRMQLTEHYWLINPLQDKMAVHTFSEYFPPECLRWQGILPDVEHEEMEQISGNEARTMQNSKQPPFIFAFVPIAWEKDYKGKGRSIVDGPNYRWQFMVKYPDGVSKADGDAWLEANVLEPLQNHPNVLRLLSSDIMQDINNCPYQRVLEAWFDGPDEWVSTVLDIEKNAIRPEWATADRYPYLKPKFGIASLFLTDTTESDNFHFHGHITMR